jgi:23S rRNA pseudouridine1911/1915/1917 synthase
MVAKHPLTSPLNGGFRYRGRADSGAAPCRVIDYLAGRYRHSSADQWRLRLERGQIEVDGAIANAGTMLRRGQLLVWHRPPWREPPAPLSFAVLHLDDDLVAVAKPSGLPTVPAGGFLEHTLLARVRRRYPDAAPAHRLGRGTSGIVLFARSRRARAGLAAAWRGNRVGKLYRALVSGVPAADGFTIDAPIGPVPCRRLGTVHASRPDGRPSLSRVRVIERRGGSALVEVEIESGRPHQIRIHLAAAGYPLLGDPFFGPGGRPADAGGALPGDTGYALHAMRLRFAHPADGREMTIECLPPPALRARQGRPGSAIQSR